MSRNEIAVLGYALLGLIHQKPSSGYDLRKIFTDTPMAGYSDSPGAIYPAIRRLEEQGLVQGSIVAGAGLRRRKVLSITPAGLAKLTQWLTGPIRQDDVGNHLNELMLRFAFLDGAAGEPATLRFLEAFEAELQRYLPTLRNFLSNHAEKLGVSGRLALECGILGYEAQLQWASRAITVYKNRENPQ
jgi:DNA-binding PadR family transcriptional regulator